MGVAVDGGVVPFYDKDEGESPVFDADRKSRRVTRIGEIAYANIDALLLECYPAPPLPPGRYPGSSFLYVDTVNIKPFPESIDDTVNDVISFDKAWATITYATLSDEEDDQTSSPGEPLITRKWGVGGEFLTIPANTLKWQTGNKPVDAEEISAAKIIPLTEHAITWNRASAIPWTAIKDNIGKVNSAALNNRYWDSVDAETLLYAGAEISYSFNQTGVQTFMIEHRFQERRVKVGSNVYGWNHFLNPSTGKWDKLIDADGNPVYPTSSTFGNLFT